jgi:hypothetical protein
MQQTQKANTPEISAQKVQVQLHQLRQSKKKKEQEGARRLSVLLIKWLFLLPSELPQHCSYLLLLPSPPEPPSTSSSSSINALFVNAAVGE